MTIIKKYIILLLCLICIIMPCIYSNTEFSYAEESDDRYWEWYPLSESAEESAFTSMIFNAYLRSRGYKQYSTPTTSLIEWEYSQLEQLCAEKGMTVSELNQYLQYAYDNNNKLHFKILKPALSLLNELYQSILYANGITPNSEKIIYSGKYYTDLNNNKKICFVDIRSGSSKQVDDYNTNFYNSFSGYGEKLYHDGKNLSSLSNVTYDTLTFSDNTSSKTFPVITRNQAFIGNSNYNGNGTFINYVGASNSLIYVQNNCFAGYDCIIYRQNGNYAGQYFLGTYCNWMRINSDGSIYGHLFYVDYMVQLKNNNNNGDINIKGNQGEEKNPYNDDDKDYVITPPEDSSDDPEVEPVNPPAEQQPVPPDSVTPNPENPTINPGNPDFNFQMPDLNINWDLGFDGENMPFPFSIPYDIKRAFEKINVEPEAPHFEGEIDLVVTTWEIDIDLSDYDDTAEIVRKWFLFLFVVSLIVATRSAMHIY